MMNISLKGILSEIVELEWLIGVHFHLMSVRDMALFPVQVCS